MRKPRNITIIIFMLIAFAFANTAGPSLPTAATGNTVTVFGGTRVWSNPTNIEANTSDATVVFLSGGGVSDDLIGTGFGFSVPLTATINGITVSETDSSTSGSVVLQGMKMLKAGAAVGTAKTSGTGNNFAIAAGTTTYGSGSDLWGTTWTASDINDANFGVVQATSGVSDTAHVRNLQVTVTFTPAVTGCKSCFMPLLKSQIRTKGIIKEVSWRTNE